MDSNVERIREAAIDHHHHEAGRFADWYVKMAESRFSNAFTYGRHKVDVIIDRELGRLPAAAKVLDVGCGTGAYLQHFAQLRLTPIGLEPAQGMLERARAANPGVDIRQGLSTALPFEDQSVDAVTAIEVFRYLHPQDIEQSFVEALRVLKPGGVLIFTMVNRWALDGFWVLQRARQWVLRDAFSQKHPHCEFYSPSQLEASLRRAGFAGIVLEGRMLAPIRFAYKLSDRIGAVVARAVEPIDDLLHEKADALTPFAGHLIAIARKSG